MKKFTSKKLIAGLSSAFLAVAAVPFTGFSANAAEAVYGDVNLDGTVDIADAVSVLNAMAGQQVPGNADVNGDGTVDIADLVPILNIMAGQ